LFDWGGFVLGFATVDLSSRDGVLTVWLTSEENARAGHTNAVTFSLSDDTTPRRALSMICDRYVVLTDRTPREHPLLIGCGTEPCDLAMLARQTTAAQAVIMTAFEEHHSKPGKAGLIEPVLPPVPQPVDQAALEADTPQQLTLAVANQVMRTWTAWLTTEGERVKRWAYMPGGYKGEKPSLLPAEFIKYNTIAQMAPSPS
jgi:hypothetical protein